MVNFSNSYTILFLRFCCQSGTRKNLSYVPVTGLIGTDTADQSFSFERSQNTGDRTLGFSCLYNQFRIGHPWLIPQPAQYSLFQVTYMVIYPAIFLTR